MASKSGVNVTNVSKADIAARSEATAMGQSGFNYSPTDTGDAAADEAFNNAALDEDPWHTLGLLMLRAEWE
jgi:hypothetical protein